MGANAALNFMRLLTKIKKKINFNFFFFFFKKTKIFKKKQNILNFLFKLRVFL